MHKRYCNIGRDQPYPPPPLPHRRREKNEKRGEMREKREKFWRILDQLRKFQGDYIRK